MNIRIYKSYSLILSILFALVGVLFLFIPDRIVLFFNSGSDWFGLPPAPLPQNAFYRILAVGYMYLVTLFAICMYKYPQKRLCVALLAHAKWFSALLSAGFFTFHQPFMIYLCNAVIDGAIGFSALWIYLKIKQNHEF